MQSAKKIGQDIFKNAKFLLKKLMIEKHFSLKKKLQIIRTILKKSGKLKSLSIPCKGGRQSKVSLKVKKLSLLWFKKESKYFCRLLSNLADSLLLKLSHLKNKFGIKTTEEYYKQIRNEEVTFFETILKSLDVVKVSRIDQISAKCLKDGALLIATCLNNINLSIKPDTFPSKCKIAKIKPLLKKRNCTDPKKYGPISILPLMVTVIDKTIHDQSQDYLQRNELQSGFKVNHSTDTRFSQLTDMILNDVENGLHASMILIDLRKNFDTLHNKTILDKKRFKGFSEKTLRWFHSYLTQRTFFVSLDNVLSEIRTINCGILLFKL